MKMTKSKTVGLSISSAVRMKRHMSRQLTKMQTRGLQKKSLKELEMETILQKAYDKTKRDCEEFKKVIET